MKKILSMLIVCVLCCGFAALAEGGGVKILACPKSLVGDYWVFNGEGVVKFGEDSGVNVVWNGPAVEGDVQTQINMMYDMIEAGVKGILVAPNDAAAVEEVVNDALEQGIVVVTWDADTANRTCMVNFAEDYSLGCQIAESLVRQMGKEEGKIALLVGQSGASNHITRAQGIRDTLAEKYPGIEIVVEMDCNDSQDIALSNAQSILASYDQIDGFATCSGCEPPAACLAIQQAIDAGQIEAGSCKVAGSNVPSSCYDYIKDGSIMSEILTSHPYQLGYAAAWMTNYLVDNGGVVPEVGTRLEIGEDIFGSELFLDVVSEDLLLTPLITVTSETIDNYDF